MTEILRETLRILNQSAPYLLLGFALAGVLHVILSRYPALTRRMTGQGTRPVLLAAFLGLPLPLCSCGVLPAALGLRKEGASKGATSSFLISVPETDIVSIVLTYALLGPVLAVYRPVAALVTAIGTGVFVNAVDRSPADEIGAKEEEHDCEDCAVAEKRGWLTRALHFGFVEMFDDIIGRLLLGIAIAGVLMTLLPVVGLENIAGGDVVTYLIMLGIGVPVYVCATASTPVAVGLIAGGVSPGAAMVFLLAGPATNLAGLVVLWRHFGARALSAYLVSIAAFTVAFGVGLDRLLGQQVLPAAAPATHEHGVSSFQWIATAVLLVIAGASLWRTRPWARFAARLRERFSRIRIAQHIDLSHRNPERCTPEQNCDEHHHGPGCGHEPVTHNGHIDYIVDGRLHHPHGNHCDDHGPLEPAAT